MFKAIFFVVAFTGLSATASVATGFEVPMMPDFSLQRQQVERAPAGIDHDLQTGSIGEARRPADPSIRPSPRKHSPKHATAH